MNCIDSEKLYEYCDGETSDLERTASQNHLNQCNDCSAKIELQTTLKSQVQKACQTPQLSEVGRARILAALAKESQQNKVNVIPFQRSKMWAAGLASAAGFMLFSGLALTSGHFAANSNLASALMHDHSRCVANAQSSTPLQDPLKLAQASFGKTPEELSFPQLKPIACKICPIDGERKALHVVYRTANEKCVSLYGLPETPEHQDLNLPESPADSKPLSEGHAALAWHHNGWVYSLVSELPPQELSQVAHQGTYLARYQPTPTNYPYLPTASSPRGYNGLAQPASFHR